LGIIAVFDWNPYQAFPWFANILYLTNLLIRSKQIRVRILISAVTIILGAFTIGIKEVLVDEGGQMESVTVGIGLSIWILSFITLLIGQLLNRQEKNDG